jgi:membrane associated rhomboid family serine protease
MSFEHASVTKGLMMGYALTSIVCGIFDVKHYLHLQLVPHISRHHQYWRLATHHVAFSSSSDLLLAELLLYTVGINVERQFGSVKFASFAIVSTLMSTILEFSSLILLHRIGINHIPPGPTAVVFSMLYQWYRLVPPAYHFRIFGVPLSNKSFTYILASQLALGHVPGSLASACLGLLVGFIYRSELINIKTWRVSPAVIRFSTRFLLPLVGSTRPPRLLNRARPEPREPTSESIDEEVVTTARPPAPTTHTDSAPSQAQGEAGNVVREWVNELRGRTEDPARIRTPSEVEISQVAAMFPDISRELITRALQRTCVHNQFN